MFSNAKSVIINNKEVKTIEDKNGGILYEKEYPLTLSVASDKDILSYYDNDTAILTTTLKRDNTPVSGEEVIFSCDDELELLSLYTNGTSSFTSNYFEIDTSNMGASTTVTFINNDGVGSFAIVKPIRDLSIMIQTDTGDRKTYPLGNNLVTVKGNKIIFTDKNNNTVIEKANIDIDKIDLSGFTNTESSNILISKKLFCETGATDSNGECSVVYKSKSVGDIIIKAECGELQETYTIEDCIFYSDSEFTSSSANQYLNIASLDNLPNSFELSVDYKTGGEARFGLFSSNNFTENPNYSVFIGSPQPSSTWYYGYRTTSTYVTDVYGITTNYHNYLIRKEGNTFYFKRDGNGSYSKLVSFFDDYTYVLGMMGWYGSSSAFAKNIKLKSL